MTNVASSTSPSHETARVQLWFRRLVFASCLALFFWIFWQHAHTIQHYGWQLRWQWLSMAVVVETAAMFLLPISSLLLVRTFHPHTSMSRIAWIYFSSQMAKYLPGGFWGFVGRGALYKQEGIHVATSAACIACEFVLIIASSATVGSPVLFRILPFALALPLLCGILVGAAGFLLKPTLVFTVLARIPRVGSHLTCEDCSVENRRTLVSVFFLYCVFWLFSGLSLHLMLRGLTETPCPLGHCVIFFAAAWVVGFLSLVTPGGFGVREGALMIMMQGYYQLEIATALVILARLLWMACEMIALGVSYFLQYRFR